MLDAKPVIIHVRYDNSLFELLSRIVAPFFNTFMYIYSIDHGRGNYSALLMALHPEGNVRQSVSASKVDCRDALRISKPLFLFIGKKKSAGPLGPVLRVERIHPA